MTFVVHRGPRAKAFLEKVQKPFHRSHSMHLLRYVFMGFSRIRERTMFIGEIQKAT